jgi:tight adherence protein B
MSLVISILIFVAVFLAVVALYFWGVSVKESPKLELRKRLRGLASDSREALPEALRSELLKERDVGERIVAAMPFSQQTLKLIVQSGVKITRLRLLSLSVLMMAAGLALGIILAKGFIISILFAAIFLSLPFLYLLYMKKQRMQKFTEQFPDALDMMSRSLKAGHSLSSAIEVISKEMTDPVAGLFKVCREQQNLGMNMTESLAFLANNVESLDLRFFITTVNIQREIGGNLAELLEKLANTIRERLKIRRQVQVYTAQGRLSGYILAALPIVTFFMIMVLLPGYQDNLLKTKPGNIIIIVALCAQLLGFLIIRKIINIRI